MPDSPLILALSCPDRPGIVAAVSTLLAESGCNIRDAQQFDGIETGRFFMRVVFDRLVGARSVAEIHGHVAALASRFRMAVSLRDTADDLVRKGGDIEQRVSARAVRYHLEDRVLLNGKKAVVFTD